MAKFPDLLELFLGKTGADLARDVLSDAQRVFSFDRLGSAPHLPAIADDGIGEGEAYVSVTLHAQKLKYGRRIATTYFPAVRCFATVRRAFAESVEFSRITTPSKLEAISKQDLGNVIFGDQPLLGPVAYWGPLQLTIALHAVPASDLAAPYLALLTDISGKVGGAWLTTAATLAEPIKRGIYAITGTGRETLEVGYVAGTLTPRTGYFAAVARENLDVSKCRLENGRLFEENGREVDEPFLVFSLTASTEIPDWWAQVPGLIEAYAKSRVPGADLDEVEHECRSLVSGSDDLTVSDRARAKAWLKARFEERRSDEDRGPDRGIAREQEFDPASAAAAARAELAGVRLADQPSP